MSDTHNSRCIAGWPMNPCHVLAINPPLCGYHRAVANLATAHLSDEEVERLLPRWPLFPVSVNSDFGETMQRIVEGASIGSEVAEAIGIRFKFAKEQPMPDRVDPRVEPLTLVEMLRAHAIHGGPKARTDEIGAKISDADLLMAAADEIERLAVGDPRDAEIERLRRQMELRSTVPDTDPRPPERKRDFLHVQRCIGRVPLVRMDGSYVGGESRCPRRFLWVPFCKHYFACRSCRTAAQARIDAGESP